MISIFLLVHNSFYKMKQQTEKYHTWFSQNFNWKLHEKLQ